MSQEQLRLEALRLALALHTPARILVEDTRVVASAQKFADFILSGGASERESFNDDF